MKDLYSYLVNNNPPNSIYTFSSKKLFWDWKQEIKQHKTVSLKPAILIFVGFDGTVLHIGSTELVKTYIGVIRGVHGNEVAQEIRKLTETHLTTNDLKSLIDSRIASKELRDTNGYIPSILSLTGITTSNNKARQFITDGAITINGIKVTNPESYITPDELIGDFIVVHFAKKLYKVKLIFK
jgi:tyrosyl-tRNA synthetase